MTSFVRFPHTGRVTPRQWAWRVALVLILLVAMAVAWVAAFALADDARPAVGVAATTQGPHPTRFYVTQPQPMKPGVETVVLLASLGWPASDFNELVNALTAAGYRTVAVESRGIMQWSGGGFSSFSLHDLADDVQRVVTQVTASDREPVHLIGHAFGNRVARTFATLFPDRTAGLVLVAAGDKTDNMPQDVARALRLSTLGFLPWSIRGPYVTQVFFAPGHVVPAYWQHGWSSWGAIGQARAAMAANSSSFHAGGSGPMLVLQAQNDVIAPPKDAGERLKAAYGARVTQVPIASAGHALLPEQPEAIAKTVVSFLRNHPAKSEGS